jgi:transposase
MFSWRRGRAYSQDLRERVLGANDLTARAAAARFGVSVSYVVKVRQRRDRLGEVTPGPQRSWTPRKLAAYHAAIAAHVGEHPDATLAELCAWVLAEFGVSASIGTLFNTLRRLGLTLKKSAWKPPSGRAPISPRRGGYGTSCSPNWTCAA